MYVTLQVARTHNHRERDHRKQQQLAELNYTVTDDAGLAYLGFEQPSTGF